MARPPKYTPDVVKKLTDAIRAGSTIRLACAYAGITEQTLSRWRRSKSGFSDALTRAEGDAAVKWLAIIDKAALGDATNPPDWRAAAWKLERRFPQEYGRNQVLDIEQRIRERAIAEGLDPDAAVREAISIIKGN